MRLVGWRFVAPYLKRRGGLRLGLNGLISGCYDAKLIIILHSSAKYLIFQSTSHWDVGLMRPIFGGPKRWRFSEPYFNENDPDAATLDPRPGANGCRFRVPNLLAEGGFCRVDYRLCEGYLT